MSARKLDSSAFLVPVTVHAPTTRLELPACAVRIRKTGIEFHSHTPLATWTEMTVVLEAPLVDSKVQCTGVVVDCTGNRHQGYTISLLFLHLTRQAQARLDQLAASKLA